MDMWWMFASSNDTLLSLKLSQRNETSSNDFIEKNRRVMLQIKHVIVLKNLELY